MIDRREDKIMEDNTKQPIEKVIARYLEIMTKMLIQDGDQSIKDFIKKHGKAKAEGNVYSIIWEIAGSKMGELYDEIKRHERNEK